MYIKYKKETVHNSLIHNGGMKVHVEAIPLIIDLVDLASDREGAVCYNSVLNTSIRIGIHMLDSEEQPTLRDTLNIFKLT